MNSKNKCKYIIGTLTTVLCLTACGHTNEEKELADFSSSISSFTASIQDANQQINELDVNDANANSKNWLTYLFQNNIRVLRRWLMKPVKI